MPVFRRNRRVMPEEKNEMNTERVENGVTALVDDPQAETASTEASDAAVRPEPVAEEQVGRAEFNKLKAERDQLLDRLARLQADFENARKRAERERVEFREFATGNVVEHFLPVLDNFALALKSTAS